MEQARATIDGIVKVVGSWRECFMDCGVTGRDIDYVASAMLPACFRLEQPTDT
jgi:hypothetical protein